MEECGKGGKFGWGCETLEGNYEGGEGREEGEGRGEEGIDEGTGGQTMAEVK